MFDMVLVDFNLANKAIMIVIFYVGSFSLPKSYGVYKDPVGAWSAVDIIKKSFIFFIFKRSLCGY
jgi:hypothetical protein